MAIDLAEYKSRLKIPARDTTLERAITFHDARELEAAGKFDDAVNAYKKVLDLAPEDTVAYVRLASLYVQRGVPRAAVMVFVALAEMHVAKERWEKAGHAYEKASELAPDDAEIHTALRDVYIKLGKLREASKVQERIDRTVGGPRPRGAVDVAGRTAPRMPVMPAAPNGEPPATVTPPPVKQPPASAAPPPPKVEPPPVGEPPRGEPKHPEATAPPAAKEPTKTDHPQPPPKDRAGLLASSRPQLPTAPPPKEVARGGQRARPRTESLGQILLDEKMVTREQLDKAIQTQHRSGGHLGRILVEQGALAEQSLANVLSIQWGLPYVQLGSLEIDATGVVPADGRDDVFLGRDYLLKFQAGNQADVIEGDDVQRVGDRQLQFLFRLLDRQHFVAVGDVLWDRLNDIGIDLEGPQLDIGQAPLNGQNLR